MAKNTALLLMKRYYFKTKALLFKLYLERYIFKQIQVVTPDKSEKRVDLFF